MRSQWKIMTSVNSLRPRPNRRHFADGIFKCTLENENEWISPRISLKFVPKVRINNITTLFQIMAWRLPGDKPLSEPMMVSLLTHICVTRPQWVVGLLVHAVEAVAKNSIPVFNSNSRVFNSNSIFNSTNFNSNFNSNSRTGIGIELQFQFRNWIDPNLVACPHNTPHIPSCYNDEQTTKQTRAINNSYWYIYISHVNVTQTVPDILPLMPMHQDPLLVDILMPRKCQQNHPQFVRK